MWCDVTSIKDAYIKTLYSKDNVVEIQGQIADSRHAQSIFFFRTLNINQIQQKGRIGQA